jgi:hypothetical protein
MSNLYSNPISLLRKTIKIKFEDLEELAYVQAVDSGGEYLEVIVNPDQTDEEFYAELYLEDEGKDWDLVEILD